jgi:hypothetical protein
MTILQSRRAALVALGTAVAVTLGVAGCGGSGQPDAADNGAPAGTSADPAPVITRWWSAGTAPVGSTTDGTSTVGAPGSSTDLTAYCASLTSTQERAGVGALNAESDPAAVPSVLLWAKETAALAPSAVATSWPPMIAMLDALAKATAGPASAAPTAAAEAIAGLDPVALAAATEAIRADALATCHLQLTIF